jgi:CubicO group peptidase (beta-lactamase class C family)
MMRTTRPTAALLRATIATAALLLGYTAHAQQPAFPPAAETDPARLGLMQGAPVPPDKQVRWDNGSMWAFPNTRWAFSNLQALVPTQVIQRSGPVSTLPVALRTDLDAVPVTLPDGRRISWADSFDLHYTDAIVVLHKGRIVHERYGSTLGEHGRHLAMSVTKSFVGTLAELLIHEGKLDESRTVASYIPELANSGFGAATVRQVLDMRTAIAFNEDYAGTGLTDVTRMGIAAGWAPSPPGFKGPDGTYAFVASIGPAGAHGGDFVYRTPNTTALQWIVERVGGAPLATQLADRIWKPMGMEQEATIGVDRIGTAFGGGSMNANIRDFARFGEMIRQGGKWNGRQILPPAVVQKILTPGDPAAFANTKYPGLGGGSYKGQWWHRATGQTMAVGIHGQLIYIDPKAELVVARFASFPVATNRAIHPTTLPAIDALAAHLAKRR